MSKSLGNCIYLSDSAAEVWKKVKKMSNGAPRMSMDEPGNLEGNAVFTYLEAFSTPDDFAEFWPEYKTLDELKDHYVRGGIGDGTTKKFLNNVLNKMLDPIRERRAEYEVRRLRARQRLRQWTRCVVQCKSTTSTTLRSFSSRLRSSASKRMP